MYICSVTNLQEVHQERRGEGGEMYLEDLHHHQQQGKQQQQQQQERGEGKEKENKNKEKKKYGIYMLII